MTDYSNLKRLADAAPMAMTMTNGSEEHKALIAFTDEVKRLFGNDVGMARVLIAEIERVVDLNHKQFGDAIRKNAEIDALRTDCARLAEDNLSLLENPGDAL
jgi:hypothetical protein